MNTLLALALGWGRVGLFGFGGGPGMIPMMQAECVEAQAWVSEDQFLDALAAASALPGPIAVKMSVMVGIQTAGWPGAVAALAGVILPAVTLMSLLAGVLLQYRQAPALSGAMRAVQPAVIGLLAWTVISLAPAGIRNWPSALIAASALVALMLKVHPAIVMVLALGVGAIFMR